MSCANCKTTSLPGGGTRLIGSTVRVLVDEPGVARSAREAPEIDGIIEVPVDLEVGGFHMVRIIDALGPDLVAESN